MRYFFHNVTLGMCLRVLGSVALFLLLSGYIIFQARSIIRGPSIVLNEYDTVVSSRIVTLTGTAQNIVKLTVNDREIHTDASGVFVEPVVLGNGLSIIELSAEDRFGRGKTLTRTFVYLPDSAPHAL